MIARRLVRGCAALLLAGALAAGAVAPASAHSRHDGNRSLAKVLAKDGAGFDRNWNDFDIVDNAVTAVLKANRSSKVGVLVDGKTRVTAFLPTDRAFRILVHDLTGSWPKTEADTFAAVAKLGIPTVEAVLLYHVVPGQTITYKQALRSDGAKLTMASGGTVTVQRRYVFIKLVDADPDDANPYVVKANINKGNKQIAHGIDRVLRPANL